MTKRKILVGAFVIFAGGLSSGLALAGWTSPTLEPATKTLLDNPRVTVTEVTMAPGARREPFTRPTDQIIIFVDDANYEATDAAGKKDARHRADGEIVWHNKGEAAPLLVNTGKKPYRNLVVSLK